MKFKSFNFIIRPADNLDMTDLFNLANQETVRKNSFHSEAIELENHKPWYSHKISDPNCLFLVARLENKFAGQLRFEIEGKSAIVGISICPELRGKGVASKFLQIGIGKLTKKFPKVKNILAYIKPDNPASIRLFEKAGFLFREKTKRNDLDALLYSFQIEGKK